MLSRAFARPSWGWMARSKRARRRVLSATAPTPPTGTSRWSSSPSNDSRRLRAPTAKHAALELDANGREWRAQLLCHRSPRPRHTDSTKPRRKVQSSIGSSNGASHASSYVARSLRARSSSVARCGSLGSSRSTASSSAMNSPRGSPSERSLSGPRHSFAA
jgi:hypothetical protein